MLGDSATTDISQVIQLVVAPVFLLLGIGSFVNAFAHRLGRIMDRARVVDALLQNPPAHSTRAQLLYELSLLRKRVSLTYLGIALATISALLVCFLIVFAFADHFFSLDFPEVIGALFITAMLALIVALGSFLREVFWAVKSFRLQRDTPNERTGP
ncbi:DUF2721 domain-containing protein [Thiorhodospira sibirica]|uniref:DUF2721 domain-containing protein n=1 Tax=Thiorhodospira sibirica TaxID=154347 RepID=UPI00022C1167|nr:DUF2721 domain-containing protein [Thiorhodospira sibirica]